MRPTLLPSPDAHRLRLQDEFIGFLLRMHETHSCLETMEKMERWIQEHRGDPRGSRLVSACSLT